MSSTIPALALAALALVAAPPHAAAQTNQPAEAFTAFTVNMSGIGSGAGTVDIVIERWSSKAEEAALQQAFADKGPEKLLDALRDTKRVGYIRSPQSTGWDLRFATQFQDEEGGRRIYLLTDRRMSFREVRNNGRTMDYPFTLIELHLDRNGEGEGRASIMTRITLNKKTGQIELENYGIQPVSLTKVMKRK
ncbi:MAG: hypothetical protein JNM38_03245 [Acidobacteria bacterium]|nr:hypothetical protein [Acidobacteriota bacterium]